MILRKTILMAVVIKMLLEEGLDENLDVALSKFLKLVRENKQKLIY